MTISFVDILGSNGDAWMSHPRRNCHIPDDFTGKDVQAAADMWFPTEKHEYESAKRLCGGCPVATQCLTYALERPELEGIWGGTTYTGRMVLRPSKKAAA